MFNTDLKMIYFNNYTFNSSEFNLFYFLMIQLIQFNHLIYYDFLHFSSIFIKIFNVQYACVS